MPSPRVWSKAADPSSPSPEHCMETAVFADTATPQREEPLVGSTSTAWAHRSFGLSPQKSELLLLPITPLRNGWWGTCEVLHFSGLVQQFKRFRATLLPSSRGETLVLTPSGAAALRGPSQKTLAGTIPRQQGIHFKLLLPVMHVHSSQPLHLLAVELIIFK